VQDVREQVATPMIRRFDAIVIGAGQAGPPMAGRIAATGKTVAVVERELVGGTCVNTGCTPTKTLVASAYAAHLARRAGDFGLNVGPVGVDFAAVMARKDKVVGASRSSVEGWLHGMANGTLVRGHASFLSPTSVRVGEDVLEAERFFLNVGCRAVVPDLPGLDEVRTLTNTTLLELDALPARLVIVGGSYIGLEFAQIFQRLGSSVTVVEKMARLIPREDEAVSDAIREALEAEGVKFRLKSECIRFGPRGADIAVGVNCEAGEPEEVGSHVLLAVGRRPNTDDLGLDAAGVKTDSHGYIVVDDELRTNVPHIWALGDCNGCGAFTHTSYNDYEIVAANLLDGGRRRVSDRIPAYALYVDPPLGRVGFTEAQARAKGHCVRVGVRPMTRVSRAVEKGETRGFIRVLVDRDSDAILGAAVLGVGGDEVVHSVIEAMGAGVTATAYSRVMAIHPTVSELLPTVFEELSP
jgi:pyruvate/2-oxoglutarate dehydrogenase complex dihydrolipoamide dehydrogenase (E3) component